MAEDGSSIKFQKTGYQWFNGYCHYLIVCIYNGYHGYQWFSMVLNFIDV